MSAYIIRNKDLKQIKRCLELALYEIKFIDKNYDVKELVKVKSNIIEITQLLDKAKKFKDED